jgi:selenocysteine lyase/cysteine desulfurase
MDIDVRASHINALCAGSHKWQMGPEGMAVFYCDESARTGLRFSRVGWKMLEDPFNYDREGRQPFAAARRFEAGSPNSIGQAALHASLGVLEEVGMAHVEQRVRQNTARLVEAIRDIPGLVLRSSPEPERYSGIVSIEPVNMDADSLRRNLSKLGFFVAVRGSAVRLSPHFYQHGVPLERLVSAIEDASVR